MSIELIMKKSEIIDKDMAKNYLKYNTWSSQRKIKTPHVRYLIDMLEKNRFHEGRLVLIQKGNDNDIIIDGQHCLYAVERSKIPADFRVMRFKCDTDLEVSEKYKDFDHAPRNFSDYLKAELDALQYDWSMSVARLVCSAAVVDYYGRENWTGNNMTTGKYQDQKPRVVAFNIREKAELIRHYKTEGDFVYKILCGAKEKTFHMNRYSVVYSMFKTMRSNYDVSLSFWKGVRDGQMLSSDSPVYMLREWLFYAQKLSSNKNKATPMHKEYISKCIYAWNAYRSGKIFKKFPVYNKEKSVEQAI